MKTVLPDTSAMPVTSILVYTDTYSELLYSDETLYKAVITLLKCYSTCSHN